MTAGRGIVLALAALVLATAVAAAAPASEIKVKPKRLFRGEVVRVFGTVAGGCAEGDRVTLISRAFRKKHEFAGLPAIFARVRSDGTFSKRARVTWAIRPGRTYSIRGRCGGGNLGVTARLRVLAPRLCGSTGNFKRIHVRRMTCRAAKRLLRRVASAGDTCPARWRCVYPKGGRAVWTRRGKRISFVPAG